MQLGDLLLPWDFFFLLGAFVGPLTLHVPCHILPYTLSNGQGCSVLTCWQMPAYVTHDCYPIMYLLEVDGNCFSIPA